MPQIDPKYDRLKLTAEYMTDPMLMALAWKKAHDYIRNTNWYADNFELDISALSLEDRCRDWTQVIKKGKTKFQDLKLIPAPKTSQWHFAIPKSAKELLKENDDEVGSYNEKCYCLRWQPLHLEDVKLRPLAHIGIKEQTIMTLIMMCLANEVEALQGDPATDYGEVHEKKVVSYGNRIYCRYSEDSEGKLIAEHNYGATTIYSKYFTDYRKFLQRPYHFAAKALPEKSPDEEVYLIELDLSQFFDLIDREKLFEKIRHIVRDEQDTSITEKDNVDTLFKAFNHWSWSACAKDAYHLCATDKVKTPRKGLPQGLVASGFLSNIYMLDLDAKISTSISSVLSKNSKSKVTLIDYCRYVDDMRLVVTGPAWSKNNTTPRKNIQSVVNDWLKPKLKRLGLELNPDKTKVEVYRGRSKGISSVLETHQSSGSGPISNESADELITQLESLLMLSNSSKVDQDSENSNCKINRLAAIEKSVFDVREDTLKRFAANKITRILNEKRHFTSRETDNNGIPIPGEWDYLQERMARRLISAWSSDPALVLLLKKGLELYPSPNILEPVLEQLAEADKRDPKQKAIANYCLAEIFRHSAIAIHRKNSHAIPAHADIKGYFELLQNRAARVLKNSRTVKSPDSKGKASSSKGRRRPFNLLEEQARFLLLVRLDTTLEKSCGDQAQDLIFKLSMGFRNIRLTSKFSDEAIASCILLASQLTESHEPVIRAASCLLDSKKPINSETVLKKMAMQDAEFVRALLLHGRATESKWFSDNAVDGFIKSYRIACT